MLYKTSMSSIFMPYKTSMSFVFMLFKTSMSYVLMLCKTSMSYVFMLYKTSMSSIFMLCKTSMSTSSAFMLYRTSVSSILCFIGLQDPLFGVTRLQRLFAFSVSLLLFSLASGFEWLDHLNEISVIIFTYLLLSIKDK